MAKFLDLPVSGLQAPPELFPFQGFSITFRGVGALVPQDLLDNAYYIPQFEQYGRREVTNRMKSKRRDFNFVTKGTHEV